LDIVQDERVFYCAKCGRSRLGHTHLSVGVPSICDGEVTIISISEWRDIAKKGELTEAGRKALGNLSWKPLETLA
jgi:hypothetical protein